MLELLALVASDMFLLSLFLFIAVDSYRAGRASPSTCGRVGRLCGRAEGLWWFGGSGYDISTCWGSGVVANCIQIIL